jgi:hypothetical protein
VTPTLKPQALLRRVALTLVSFKAQPLLSHAFYFFIESVHFLVVLFVLRLGTIAFPQLLKRFLDRKF